MGSLCLLQGIFPIQGLNPGLLHCRQILYQLSHKGSLRILEWVAYPFSGGPSQPRIERGSPALQADSLPTELSGKPEVPGDTAFFIWETCLEHEGITAKDFRSTRLEVGKVWPYKGSGKILGPPANLIDPSHEASVLQEGGGD